MPNANGRLATALILIGGISGAFALEEIEESVLCDPYPCLWYNSSGACAVCDCRSVECPADKYITKTCQCSGGDITIKVCTDCNTNVVWTADIRAGAEKRYADKCDIPSITCKANTEYRCAAGYYGSAPFLCNDCKTATGNSAATSQAGQASDVTSCYLPAGYIGNDASGTYTYTANCFYSD